MWVELRALQENKISPQAFVNGLRQEINEYPLITHIIVPLRIDPAKRQPSATQYINQFTQVGWNIIGLVILGRAVMPQLPAISGAEP